MGAFQTPESKPLHWYLLHRSGSHCERPNINNLAQARAGHIRSYEREVSTVAAKSYQVEKRMLSFDEIYKLEMMMHELPFLFQPMSEEGVGELQKQQKLLKHNGISQPR